MEFLRVYNDIFVASFCYSSEWYVDNCRFAHRQAFSNDFAPSVGLRPVLIISGVGKDIVTLYNNTSLRPA